MDGQPAGSGRHHLNQAINDIDKACALIRAGYCREANAQDALGTVRGVFDPEATAWSLYGALLRATGGDDFTCQTSTAFELVVQVLRDFHALRPQEIGWHGAIVLYEQTQVVEVIDGGTIRTRSRSAADALSLLSRARARGTAARRCPSPSRRALVGS